MPVAPGYPSDEAMDVACRLARERGSRIVAMTVIEVPLELPLDAYLPDAGAGGERAARRGAGDRRVVRRQRDRAHRPRAQRRPRDRRRGVRRGSEIIVMGGPRRVRLAAGKRAIFGDTVDFVLKHAPVRVMVAAGRAAE